MRTPSLPALALLLLLQPLRAEWQTNMERVTAILKALPALPKRFFSGPVGGIYLENETVADGVLVDYVRITGGFTVSQPTDATAMEFAVGVCARAGQRHEGGRAGQIGVQL